MQDRPIHSDKQKVIDFGINRGYIELSEDEKKNTLLIVNKLITTLIYESRRHTWWAPHCQEIREHICMLAPQFRAKDEASYAAFIAEQESLNRNFYGSYLSDDSDSEEELEYQKKGMFEKIGFSSRASKYRMNAQMDHITYQKKTKTQVKEEELTFEKGDLKANGSVGSKLFVLSKRHEIHHGPKVDLAKVQRDIDNLNELLRHGVSPASAIKTLTEDAQKANDTFTTFYIAEYRGITHGTAAWNKPSRIAHRRDKLEIGERQYASSVYKTAGVSLFRDYANVKNAQRKCPQWLDRSAEILREVLLTLREPKPYSYNGYAYRSLAYVLQNIYTQDYYGFQELIKQDPSLSILLPEGGIPFVSMGCIPYHGLKYAYGLKPYKGHKDERLRPRWRSDGRAERPYSGVLYTSLHPITDFDTDGPLHVVSLNRNAEIRLQDELFIIAEHESCFPAYLPEGRVIHKHIAKYPSFKKGYKSINLDKYGLSQLEYSRFRKGLLESRPHTKEHKRFKILLGEALCSYQEVRHIDIARMEAERRGGVLIYSDINGTFSLRPPVDSVNRNTLKITPVNKQGIKKLQAERVQLADANPLLKELLDPDTVDCILGEYDGNDEAAMQIEGNHGRSLPVSLMLNAITHHRYLALQHFLRLPLFRNAINETFNTHELLGATLLHVAVENDDAKAIGLLLSIPQCRPDIGANEVFKDPESRLSFHCCGHDFLEGAHPIHYAITHKKNKAAEFLLHHSRQDTRKTCAYVTNKNLYNTDEIIECDDDVGQDGYLGVAFHHREGETIERVKENNLFHLAVMSKNYDFLAGLKQLKTISSDSKNTRGLSANDIAQRQNDTTAKLLMIKSPVSMKRRADAEVSFPASPSKRPQFSPSMPGE